MHRHKYRSGEWEESGSEWEELGSGRRWRVAGVGERQELGIGRSWGVGEGWMGSGRGREGWGDSLVKESEQAGGDEGCW
ncbi:hypothetical protein Pmani_019151 [Petrolisthes manimaculis]|uniref:Uncharacterized protein n=1 Tax=Petrolisthes manimaculis TaxID=1843537 RepID=A0AAE1PIB2_9EUCA|nr:hypothetical protein Pmani_019151 [Petrolisthes manimaculis]